VGGSGRIAVACCFILYLLFGVCAQIFLSAAACAQSVNIPFPEYRYYGGVGVGGVHHTGYVPHSIYNAEAYDAGFKGFLGYRLNGSFALELGYDYVGTSTFDEGFATPSRERSFALTGTAIYFSPPMSEWLMPTFVPVRMLARGGLAYKNIHQAAADGTFDEGILSFVIGGGAEFELSPRWFMRLEYEFVSTAVGGPSEPFRALNGLFTADFGGTQRVINVMHTELAASIGVRF
jgi:opacity protein-like surface antigen